MNSLETAYVAGGCFWCTEAVFQRLNGVQDIHSGYMGNKYIITIIGILFAYIFYLLIPLLYDKSWVQNKIVSKLSAEFKSEKDN